MRLNRFLAFFFVFHFSLVFGQYDDGILIAPSPKSGNVEMVDFDRDGFEDIYFVGKNIWLRNLGDNTFEAPQTLIDFTENSSPFYLMDFDEDGTLDLLYYESGLGIVWLKDYSPEGFAEEVVASNTGISQYSEFGAFDYDNDGDNDLFYSSNSQFYFQENLDNVDFEFRTAIQQYQSFPGWELADIDQDGYEDVFFRIVNPNSGAGSGIGFYAGGENGLSTDSVYLVPNYRPQLIGLEDLDQDGDLDIFSNDGGAVGWFENDEMSFETFHELEVLSEYEELSSFSGYDINEDGLVDIFWSSDDEELRMHLNEGNGNFSEPVDVGGSYEAFLLEDLTFDGKKDLIGISRDQSIFIEYLEDSFFGESKRITLSEYEFSTLTQIANFDFDGDGDSDLLCTTNLGHALFENRGAEKFRFYHLVPSTLYIDYLDIIDVNQDGILDLTYAATQTAFGSHYIYYQLGLGNGNFGIPQLITTYGSFRSFKFEDINGDDIVDFIGQGLNTVRVFEGAESEGFNNLTPQIQEEQQYSTNDIDLFDYDNDGLKDLFVTRTNGTISVFKQNADFVFTLEEEFSGTGAARIEIEDFNGDSSKDIMLIKDSAPRFSLLENDGNNNFGSPVDLDISHSFNTVHSVYSKDLDGDSDLDLIVYNGYNSLSLAYNNGALNFSEESVQQSSMERPIFRVSENGVGLDITLVSDEVILYKNLAGQTFCHDETACNFDLSAPSFGEESCCFENCGCTDTAALNFDPTAVCDTGGCEYEIGCTNELASNYNPEAQQDDGSCLLPLEIFVFHDENENGVFDEGEVGLANQSVSINQEINAFTSALGYINLVHLEQEIWLGISPSEPFDIPTSDPNPSYDPAFWSGNTLFVGLSDEEPIIQASVTHNFQGIPTAVGYPCDDEVWHSIGLINESTYTRDFYLEYTFDPLFSNPIFANADSIVQNTVYLSAEGVVPGQFVAFNGFLNSPTADFIGTFFTHNILWQTMSISGELVENSETFSYELTCAYDPNDKQVDPVGYTEEHYILNNTDLEYFVRFQNTGNAFATNVLVADTMSSNLDVNTLEIIASSHAMTTTINEESGRTEFFFSNILLPDSTFDEPNSHGFLAYRIRAKSELQHLDKIENTAYIYFDNNPPIITNTTFHNILDCDSLGSQIWTTSDPVCTNVPVTIDASFNDEVVDHLSWWSDGELFSEEFPLEIEFPALLEFITLRSENPLCIVNDIIGFPVHQAPPIPEVVYGIEGLSVLNADSFVVYQWFHESNLIQSFNGSVLPLESDDEGIYTVIGFNPFGCSSTSEPIVVTDIVDVKKEALSIFPNPVKNTLNIESKGETLVGKTIEIHNAQGALVFSELCSKENLTLDLGWLSSGFYTLKVSGYSQRFKIIKEN